MKGIYYVARYLRFSDFSMNDVGDRDAANYGAVYEIIGRDRAKNKVARSLQTAT